jgi:hypothetical protein
MISDIDGCRISQRVTEMSGLWWLGSQGHPVQSVPELRTNLRTLRQIPILRSLATWVKPWEDSNDANVFNNFIFFSFASFNNFSSEEETARDNVAFFPSSSNQFHSSFSNSFYFMLHTTYLAC